MQQQQERDDDVGNALQRFLAAGTIEIPLDAGTVRTVFTSLPGRTACAAVRDENGVLWIFCDDAKPWARGQAAEMLADGCLSYCVNLVQVTAMRGIPTRGTRGRVRMALV